MKAEEIFERDSIVEELSRMTAYLDSHPDATYSILNARFLQLPDIRTRFLSAQLAVELSANDEELADCKKVRFTFEDDYVDTFAAYNERIDKLKPPPVQLEGSTGNSGNGESVEISSETAKIGDSNVASNGNLGQTGELEEINESDVINDSNMSGEAAKVTAETELLKIPDLLRFYGRRYKYIPFRERFISQINEHLAEDETEKKLAHLKKTVFREPADLIKNATDYDEAWKMLDEKYYSLADAIPSYVDAITSFRLNPTNPTSFRILTKLAQDSLTNFQKLGKENSGDFVTAMIVALLADRLNENLITAWRSRMLETNIILPTSEEFFEFMENCAEERIASGEPVQKATGYDFKGRPKFQPQKTNSKNDAAAESKVPAKSTNAVASNSKKIVKNGEKSAFVAAQNAKKTLVKKQKKELKKPNAANSKGPFCSLCKIEKHILQNCPKFVQFGMEKRLKYVNAGDRCVCCLSVQCKQRGGICPRKKGCKICHLPHHELLHDPSLGDGSKRKGYGSKHSNEKMRTHPIVQPFVKGANKKYKQAGQGQEQYRRPTASLGHRQELTRWSDSSYAGQRQEQFGRTNPTYGRGQAQFGRSYSSYGSGQEQFGRSDPSYGQGKFGGHPASLSYSDDGYTGRGAPSVWQHDVEMPEPPPAPILHGAANDDGFRNAYSAAYSAASYPGENTFPNTRGYYY